MEIVTLQPTLSRCWKVDWPSDACQGSKQRYGTLKLAFKPCLKGHWY